MSGGRRPSRKAGIKAKLAMKSQAGIVSRKRRSYTPFGQESPSASQTKSSKNVKKREQKRTTGKKTHDPKAITLKKDHGKKPAALKKTASKTSVSKPVAPKQTKSKPNSETLTKKISQGGDAKMPPSTTFSQNEDDYSRSTISSFPLKKNVARKTALISSTKDLKRHILNARPYEGTKPKRATRGRSADEPVTSSCSSSACACPKNGKVSSACTRASDAVGSASNANCRNGRDQPLTITEGPRGSHGHNGDLRPPC